MCPGLQVRTWLSEANLASLWCIWASRLCAICGVALIWRNVVDSIGNVFFVTCRLCLVWCMGGWLASWANVALLHMALACLGPGCSGGGQHVAIRLFPCSQAEAGESRPAEEMAAGTAQMSPFWASPLTFSREQGHVDDDTGTPCYVSNAPSCASFQLWRPPLRFPVHMDSDEARVHGEPGPLRQDWREVRSPSIFFILLDFLHLLVMIDLELYMCGLIMVSLEFCLFCLWVSH
jgi:hypothetical protein